MPFAIDEFIRLAGAASHGFLRSFNADTTELRALIKSIRDRMPFRVIYGEYEKITLEKKKKYKAALDYFLDNYENIAPQPLAEGHAARVIALGDGVELLLSPLRTTSECVIYGHAGQVPTDDRFNGKFTIQRGCTLHFWTLHGQSNESNPTRLLDARPDDNEVKFVVKSYKTQYLDRNLNVIAGARFDSPDVRAGRLRPHRAETSIDPAKAARAARFFGAMDGLHGKRFSAGDECFNYVVKNGLGIHWASDNAATTRPYGVSDIIRKQDAVNGAIVAGQIRPWCPHVVHVADRSVQRLSDLLTRIRSHFVRSAVATTVTDYYFAGCRGIHPNWRADVE